VAKAEEEQICASVVVPLPTLGHLHGCTLLKTKVVQVARLPSGPVVIRGDGAIPAPLPQVVSVVISQAYPDCAGLVVVAQQLGLEEGLDATVKDLHHKPSVLGTVLLGLIILHGSVQHKLVAEVAICLEISIPWEPRRAVCGSEAIG